MTRRMSSRRTCRYPCVPPQRSAAVCQTAPPRPPGRRNRARLTSASRRRGLRVDPLVGADDDLGDLDRAPVAQRARRARAPTLDAVECALPDPVGGRIAGEPDSLLSKRGPAQAIDLLAFVQCELDPAGQDEVQKAQEGKLL